MPGAPLGKLYLPEPTGSIWEPLLAPRVHGKVPEAVRTRCRRSVQILFLFGAVLLRDPLGTLASQRHAESQGLLAFLVAAPTRPNSFHFGKVASGPGGIPRSKHWNEVRSWFPSENVNCRTMLVGCRDDRRGVSFCASERK